MFLKHTTEVNLARDFASSEFGHVTNAAEYTPDSAMLVNTRDTPGTKYRQNFSAPFLIHMNEPNVINLHSLLGHFVLLSQEALTLNSVLLRFSIEWRSVTSQK